MSQITPYQEEPLDTEIVKWAETFIGDLPEDPHFINNEIQYPPQGLKEIAKLMAAFHQFMTQWRH